MGIVRSPFSAFAAAYDDAWQMGAEALEAEAHDRATRPNFPSDALLMFLLKGALPSRYRERSSVELSGPNGKPIQLDYSRLSDEQLATLEQLCAIATRPAAEIEAPTIDVASAPAEPPIVPDPPSE